MRYTIVLALFLAAASVADAGPFRRSCANGSCGTTVPIRYPVAASSHAATGAHGLFHGRVRGFVKWILHR